MVAFGSFAIVLIVFKPSLPSGQGEAVGAAAVFLPVGIAAWWMFRRLLATYPRSEAWAAAIAFGAITPLSLIVSVFLAQIPGSYANILVGPRFFGLLGAFFGIVVMSTFLSFLACSLVLWITRKIKRA